MNHEGLGELTYDRDDETWRTYRPLRQLVASDLRQGEGEPEVGNETERAVKSAIDRLRATGLADVQQLFQALEEEIARGELGQAPTSGGDLFHSAEQLEARARAKARTAL